MLERGYEGDAGDTRRPALPPERESLLTGKPLPPRPPPVYPPDDYNLRDTLLVRKMNPTFVPPPSVASVNPSVVSSTKNIYGGPDVSDMLKSIQTELDTLKESVRTGSKGGDSCFYERIDDLHRTRPSSKPCRDFIVKNARDRGLVRIRTIVDPNTGIAARLLWILLCAASLTFLSYQLYDRITLYFRFPSHTTIETRTVEKLDFPVVTVCNLNKYRLTNTVSLGVYTPLHEILHQSRPLNYSGVVYQLDKSNLSYMDLLTSATHRRVDSIYSCRYKGRACNDADFTDTFSDYGRCFTFRRLGADRAVTKTGILSGLSLVINVEQYDYLLGPKSAVGMRVSIRDSASQLISDANTINIPVGKYTSLDVTKVKRHEQRSLYNDCQETRDAAAPTASTYDQCLTDCRQHFFFRRCNCVPIASQNTKGSYRACGVSEYFACSLNQGRNSHFDESFCGCTRNCETTEYEMTSSQASISSYGAESSVRNFQERFNLEKRYRHAMDTYHRVDQTIFQHDLRMLQRIPKELEDTTRKKKFADYLMRYDEKQDEKITATVDLLNKTLKTLNTTVYLDYVFFEQGTHITYTVYGERIKNQLNMILKSEDSLKHRFNVDASDSEVQAILRRIQNIVAIDSNSDSVTNYKEIKSGIESFRRSLFKGYGQYYIEFQTSKKFYMEATQTVLDKAANLSIVLKNQYISLSTMKQRDSMRVLTKFFWHIRNLISNEMPPILDLLEKIFNQYNKDRVKVKHFIESLPVQSKRLLSNLGIWRQNLTQFREAVTSLPMSLSSLREEMTSLASSYVKKNYGKGELSQKLQSQAISGPLKRAQTVLREIGAMADKLSEQGTNMAAVMEDEGLTSRLVDFGLTKKEHVDQLLQWIKFRPLKQQVTQFVDETDSKLRLIMVFREELQEYVDSIKIDENFYRNNFLHLDVSYRDLTETIVSQKASYSLLDLACDVGGAMALCIGASLLTIFDIAEFLERCLYYYFCKR